LTSKGFFSASSRNSIGVRIPSLGQIHPFGRCSVCRCRCSFLPFRGNKYHQNSTLTCRADTTMLGLVLFCAYCSHTASTEREVDRLCGFDTLKPLSASRPVRGKPGLNRGNTRSFCHKIKLLAHFICLILDPFSMLHDSK
jgi:hypothetical protein